MRRALQCPCRSCASRLPVHQRQVGCQGRLVAGFRRALSCGLRRALARLHLPHHPGQDQEARDDNGGRDRPGEEVEPLLRRRRQDALSVAVHEVLADLLLAPPLCQSLPHRHPHLRGQQHLRLVDGLAGAERADERPVQPLSAPFQVVLRGGLRARPQRSRHEHEHGNQEKASPCAAPVPSVTHSHTHDTTGMRGRRRGRSLDCVARGLATGPPGSGGRTPAASAPWG